MQFSVKVEIPDGYELACDTMRPVRTDELYLHETITGDTTFRLWPRTEPSRAKCVIVRTAWVWPEWLTAVAIVRLDAGGVYACTRVPELCEESLSGWRNLGTHMHLDGVFVQVDYPAGPWRESLRLNPNLDQSK